MVFRILIICLLALGLNASTCCALDKEQELLTLARKTFGHLSQEDIRLFKAATNGPSFFSFGSLPVNVGHRFDVEFLLRKKELIGSQLRYNSTVIDQVCVSPKKLTWLFSDSKAQKYLYPGKIDFQGFVFSSLVDDESGAPTVSLENKVILHPVEFISCVFVNFNFSYAKLKDLIFTECYFERIVGMNAEITGNLAVNGCGVAKEASFFGAKVGKNLSFRGTNLLEDTNLYINCMTIGASLDMRKVTSPNDIKMYDTSVGWSVFADGACLGGISAWRTQIGRSLHLRKGVQAKGELLFTGATIGGWVELGGNFASRRDSSSAVMFNGATIDGYFYIEKGTNLTGLDLNNAIIHRYLVGDGVTFTSEHGESCNLGSSYIRGNVSLQNSTFHGPLNMQRFRTGGDVYLHSSTFISNDSRYGRSIDLIGSLVGGWFGCKNSTSKGEFSALGSSFEQGFSLGSSRFVNPKGKAINFERVNVGSTAFLQGITATGSVYFRGANFDEGVEMEHSVVSNPKKLAIDLEDASLKGDFFLRHAHINGRINMSGTMFVDNVEFTNSVVKNPKNIAIEIDGAVINKDIFFDNMKVLGQIRLKLSRFYGSLLMRNASVANSSGIAINAAGIQANSQVLLSENFHAAGGVDFSNSYIGGPLWLNNATFRGNGTDTILARSAVIDKDVIASDGVYTNGVVDFEKATLKGAFSGSNSTFTAANINGISLNFSSGSIEKWLVLNNDFSSSGTISLEESFVGGRIDLRKGKFNSTSGVAFNGNRLACEGSMLFDDGFLVDGEVRLNNAEIKRTLVIRNSKKSNLSYWDLRHAHVGILYDSKESWPDEGRLMMYGFKYDSLHADAPQTVQERVLWLSKNNGDNSAEQPYYQLASAFIDAGKEREANEVMFELKSRIDNPNSDIRHYLLGVVVGYGYKPERALVVLAFIYFFGVVVFEEGYRRKIFVSIYKDRPLNFNSFVYSLDMLIPLADLNHARNWQITQSKGAWLFSIYQMIHTVLGWIVASMGLAVILGIIS